MCVCVCVCVCVCASPQCVPVESLVKPVLRRVCAPTTAPVTPSTAPVSATLDGSARTAPNVRWIIKQIISLPLSLTFSLLSSSSPQHLSTLILCFRKKDQLKLISSAFCYSLIVLELTMPWTSQRQQEGKKKLEGNYSTGSDINYPLYTEQRSHNRSITCEANEGTDRPDLCHVRYPGWWRLFISLSLSVCVCVCVCVNGCYWQRVLRAHGVQTASTHVTVTTEPSAAL